MIAKCDVLGLGATAVDELLYVEEHPPADGKARVLRRVRQCGGLTATALVASARLGGRCAFAGVLGQDANSRFVLRTLQRERVNTRLCVREPKARPIQSTIIVEEKSQRRTVFYDLAGVRGAHEMAPSEAVIRSTRVLLVDNFGVKGMERAARIARAAGIPVVGDFEGESADGLEDLLFYVDHLILSESFSFILTGLSNAAAAAMALWNEARAVVIVTRGALGCCFLAGGMKLPESAPAFKVHAMDTTGCGDVFHGAYALALARKRPLAERIRFASAAAALKATCCGGQAGCPTMPAVKKFLKEADS